ncbi:hypothetical protein SISSUDRAFT_1058638 [Sistotremastrum suecicum HHB10207 ss-3]|uniref:Uncharacterized protein n=1 Tax=Sistotremastrum suecicum HHB10207 ss-3 TaxID=1314776 RepID=A0A166H2L9_9AGAM|nr:hypothetical protein SISSUDRAFT_1058638 [Sistotremastrum suecicum HHB10207 ss-3]
MRAVDLRRRFLDSELKPLRISKEERKPWYIFNEKWVIKTDDDAAMIWIVPTDSADSYRSFDPIFKGKGRFGCFSIEELDDRKLAVIFTVVPHQASISDVFHLDVLLMTIPAHLLENQVAPVFESKRYLLPYRARQLFFQGSRLFIKTWNYPPYHYLMLDYERNLGVQLIVRTPDGEPAFLESHMGHRKELVFHAGLSKIVIEIEISRTRTVLLLADVPTIEGRSCSDLSKFSWKAQSWDATHMFDLQDISGHNYNDEAIMQSYADTFIAVDSFISPRYTPVHEFVFRSPLDEDGRHRQFVSICLDTETDKLVALAFPPENPADHPTAYWTIDGPVEDFVEPDPTKERWMIICPDSSGRQLSKFRITFPPEHSEEKSYLVLKVDMRKGELLMYEKIDYTVYQGWVMQY